MQLSAYRCGRPRRVTQAVSFGSRTEAARSCAGGCVRRFRALFPLNSTLRQIGTAQSLHTPAKKPDPKKDILTLLAPGARISYVNRGSLLNASPLQPGFTSSAPTAMSYGHCHEPYCCSP